MSFENSDDSIFTVSKMLDSINDTMEPVGGKVELKRTTRDGRMYDTSDSEINILDTQARMKVKSELIQKMSREERIEYLDIQKSQGNDCYRTGNYKDAIQKYIDALLGIDFGRNEQEKKEIQTLYQIPITCNLAACMIATKQWVKAISVCDQVINIDPKCIKALRRRGQAYIQLEKFDQGRQDLELALDLSLKGDHETHSQGQKDSENSKMIEQQLRKLKISQTHHSRNEMKRKQNHRRMMTAAVGNLYLDKRNVLDSPIVYCQKSIATYVQNGIDFILSCCQIRKKKKNQKQKQI